MPPILFLLPLYIRNEVIHWWKSCIEVVQEIVVTSIGQAIQYIYPRETCVFVICARINIFNVVYYIYVCVCVYSVVQTTTIYTLTFFLSRKFTIKMRSDNLICHTIIIKGERERESVLLLKTFVSHKFFSVVQFLLCNVWKNNIVSPSSSKRNLFFYSL